MKKIIVGESGPTEYGYHAIEAYLRCPQEYLYSKVRGVRENIQQTPDPLAEGALVHAGRARWFAIGFADQWSQIQEAVEDERVKLPLPVSKEAFANALRRLQGYMQFWSSRPKPKPVAAEYLVGPATIIKGSTEVRTARLDDVSKYSEAGGKLCIGECKTTSVGVDDAVNQYTLHGQPLLQVLLWKHSKQGEAQHGPVSGVVLDVIVKGYGRPDKFARVFLPVTEKALTWYAKSLDRILKRASLLDWNSEVIRNTSSCTRLIGRKRVACPFRELCMHGRAGATKYLLNNKPLAAWKPSPGKETPPWE